METISYQCPSCGAPLEFNGESGKWDCKFCLSSFTVDVLDQQLHNKAEHDAGIGIGDESPSYDPLHTYSCPGCGAQVVTDAQTAATFCVFCGQSVILQDRVSKEFRPHKLIPFQTTKEDAKNAFSKLCKKKPLLPRWYYDDQQMEKISGVYVPFWLFDCKAHAALQARATRVNSWSDSKYRYTKTDYYQIVREGDMRFERVPADASTKMQDDMMDSIEPYDYSKLVDFTPAYLSGYLAEKYDVDDQKSFARARTRMEKTAQDVLKGTVTGYTTVTTQTSRLDCHGTKASYAMLPVWMLMSKYKEKTYLFAMNAQSGKIVGNLPISIPKAIAWFCGITLGTFLLLFLGGMLI